MNQYKLDEAEEQKKKEAGLYDKSFEACGTTFSGFDYDFSKKKTFDDTPEEREKFFHNLLIEQGGFRFWLGTYSDMLYDEAANTEAYNFWRKSVHARMKNKEKAELLASEVPPHPWGLSARLPALSTCLPAHLTPARTDLSLSHPHTLHAPDK